MLTYFSILYQMKWSSCLLRRQRKHLFVYCGILKDFTEEGPGHTSSQSTLQSCGLYVFRRTDSYSLNSILLSKKVTAGKLSRFLQKKIFLNKNLHCWTMDSLNRNENKMCRGKFYWYIAYSHWLDKRRALWYL